MAEDNKRKAEELKEKKRRKRMELVLGVILIAFIVYKFSLWNFFGFVVGMDAKGIIEDFEKYYLYKDTVKTEQFTKMKNDILGSTFTSKEKLNELFTYAENANGDKITHFKYADVLKGKFGYSTYIRLRFESKSMDGDKAYIKLNTFWQGADKKFYRALKKYKKKDYLVLDLRDNYKGDYNEVVNIVDNLLPDGAEICNIEMGHSTHAYTSDTINYNFKKIYVLLNEKSGYCSEIAALALKENLGDKVVLIGSKTMQKNVGEFYKSYYNKINFDIAAVKWSVKGKTGSDLAPYLSQYSNTKLEKLDDYMTIVRSLK